VGTVSVLSGVAPGAAQGEFRRLLIIASDGLSTVRFIVPLDSGGLSQLGAGAAPASMDNGQG
jgi:hypothetical protein